MSKLKHTPGPWNEGYNEGVTGPTCPSCFGPTVAGNEWDYTVVSKNMSTIAIIPKQEDGIMEANAHLIAAAPEMLEALIECYKVSLYSEDRGLLPLNKMRNITERATGLKIEEIINE